jgi:hypothetical protein
MGSGEKDRKCVSVGNGMAQREVKIERGIALLKIRALLRNKSKRPTMSKLDPRFEAVVPISDLTESSIPDTGMLSEIVCVSVGDGSAPREEEIERGIALLKFRALLRNKSKKPTMSKSDPKFEAVVPISDLNESSIPDTRVPSEIACCFSSKKRPKNVSSWDENKAKYSDEIGDETVNSRKLSDTAATSDKTFELLFGECDAGEKGTIPEPEGDDVTCDETFELSFEDYDAGEEGPKPEPEDAADGAASEKTVHIRQLWMESLLAVFGGQKSNDSDAVALPKGEEVSTKLDSVSTKLDEVEAAERACAIKSQLETAMHPKNDDAEENVNPEPRSTFIGMIDASNPMNPVDDIEDVANRISNCQVASTDFILTVSEGVHRVFVSVQDRIFHRGPDPDAFRRQLELMRMLVCNFTDTLICGQIDLMGMLICNCTDTLFDEKSVVSIYRFDKNAVSTEGKVNDIVNAVSTEGKVNDIVNAVSTEGKVNDIVNENGSLHENDDHLKQGTVNFDLGEPKDVAPKGKGGLWKRLSMRKNRAKNKSGKIGLEKLYKSVSTQTTLMANDLVIATNDVSGGSAKTGARTQRELRSVQTFHVVTELLKPKETKPDARPLRVWQVNADSSKSFWESGLMQMLENAVVPKKDDESYQSSLGYIYIDTPDWGSAVSELEDEGSIVAIFAADYDGTLRQANAPIFVRGQKGASPDMSRTSTKDLSQTDDEAEPPKLGQVVQVAAGDCIKTLETTPAWKVAVDPKTGRAYYYNRHTRETTWSTPPDFDNK